MTPSSFRLASAVLLILAGMLAGCAMPGARGAQPMASSGSATAPMPCSACSGQDGTMSPQAMCEMHKKMMGEKSPQEQQAMMAQMEAHMKSMSPEMRQRHLQMMQAQCGGSNEHQKDHH